MSGSTGGTRCYVRPPLMLLQFPLTRQLLPAEFKHSLLDARSEGSQLPVTLEQALSYVKENTPMLLFVILAHKYGITTYLNFLSSDNC